jgi:hypothetical protein
VAYVDGKASDEFLNRTGSGSLADAKPGDIVVPRSSRLAARDRGDAGGPHP